MDFQLNYRNKRNVFYLTLLTALQSIVNRKHYPITTQGVKLRDLAIGLVVPLGQAIGGNSGQNNEDQRKGAHPEHCQ